MKPYPERTNAATVPLDSLPGGRCTRALARLKSLRENQHIALDDVLCLTRSRHVDELALVDLHRSGIVRVLFNNPEFYVIDLRRGWRE